VKHPWNPARTVLLWGIRGYQSFISPFLPRRCKYYPSCSQYAVDALSRYGIFRGIVLAAWRLLRCNPMSYGGYDPVERQTLFATRPRATEASGQAGGDASASAERRGGLTHGGVIGC
jgi:putative membrane protein insertion efficiency factor